MPKPAKLNPEQEFAAYQRAKRGDRYDLIAADYKVHKSTITRLVQRLEARAVAADIQPPAKDPQTGVEVEVTDELLLGQVIRDLTAIYHRSNGDTETKVSIAHVLPKLAAARHRIRQPVPGPKPPDKPPPSEPPSPQPPTLVRFN